VSKQLWLDTHIHVSDVLGESPDRQRTDPNLFENLSAVLDGEPDVDLRFLMSCDGYWMRRIGEDASAMTDGNRLIHDLCRRAPERFYGSCTINLNFLDDSLRAMETCFTEWGFIQLGEMLGYAMDYCMDTDAGARAARAAIDYKVPMQVHISTSNAGTGNSSHGMAQLHDLLGLVNRVPECRYILAHCVGMPDADPPVAEQYFDVVEKAFGSWPQNVWVEIRDFDSPGVPAALARVPHNRLLAGTDWTNRIGPPYQPYGMIFNVPTPEENPYPPRVSSLIGFLRSAGASDQTIRRIAFGNAAELYGLTE